MRTAARWRLLLRFLRGSYPGLALTVLAVACGVGLVCAIDLASRAALQAFVEVVDTMAGRAALQVGSGEGGVFAEEVAATVAGVPGVAHALPLVSASAFTIDGSGEQLAVYGVDLTDEAVPDVYGMRGQEDSPHPIEDTLAFLAQPDSVLLTRTFARERGLVVGDRVELMTPAGRRALTVRGLLEPSGIARVHGGTLAVMDLFAAEAVFTRPAFVNRVDVVLERGSDAQTVAAAIGRALPPGLMVTAPAQRRADLDRWLGSLRLALRALSLVGLVAAFLIAFNRLTTAFERRAWQVGVLRAAGVRRRTLWLLLLEEGLLVGVLGAALGIPLGIGLARLLLPLIAASAALHYKLFAPEAVLTLPATSLALAAGTGLGASLLAAVLPAWRVSRVAVVETLRGRGVEQEGARPRWMRVAVRATLGGLTAAVVAQAATRSATYGLLATGLIAVGTALAAAPLVRVASSGLARGCRGLAGPGSRFAVCTLGRNPRRSALTVATFGVGLGCVIWFWTVATSFERSLVESLTAAVRAELVVTSSHTTAGYLEAPLSAEVQAELAQVAGVAEVAGMRVIDWPHAGTRIAIDAFDPQYFTDGFGRWPLRGERIAGVWGAVARGEAVIVSANFAMNLNARVGDTVVLGTPSGPLPLLVGGLTPAFESPAGTLAMSRVLFSRLWHDHQVTRIAVRTALGVRVAAVRAAIARALGQAHDLRILSAGELIGHYAAQVRRAFAPVHILGALVLVVTLLGLTDALAAGVQDRRRELGTLRALGVRRGYVGRMIVVEALVLGGLGFLLALAAGFSLAVLWVEATLPYLLGWVVDLHLPYAQVPAAGAVSVAVCLSAALVPARRAARLQPLRALRDE